MDYMSIYNKITSLAIIAAVVFMSGCGKRETIQQRNQRLQSQASMLCEDISKRYDQELDLIKNETDSLKIKNLLGEVVGDKKYSPNLLETIFRTKSPKLIPFHKYNEILTHDVNSLRLLIVPLNKGNQSTQAELNKIIDMMQDLKEIQSYILKHREYRDEERYLKLCAAKW